MTLLIDIGNTRLKVGSTKSPQTYAITHDQLHQLLPWIASQPWENPPKKAFGSCVASQHLAETTERLLKEIGCQIQWVDATLACDILHNNYEQPQRLGADRWLGLIGMLDQYPQHKHRPMIHASFGTATTIDTVLPAKAKAQFIGGLILPGPKLMYDSLATNTSQLGSDIGVIAPYPLTTHAAISTGINAAQAGAVLRQWQLTWEQQLGAPLLVCSGGGWELIKDELTSAYTEQLKRLRLPVETIIWQPTPVLNGLNYVAAQAKTA